MLFNLIVDEKVKVWRRSYCTIEANSLEEAANKCLKEGIDEEDYESDYIYETEELIKPNSEEPCTCEIMNENYEVIKSNDIFSKSE